MSQGTVSQGSIFSLTNPEIYVLTVAHDGEMGGQVATWVSLASLIPEAPRVITILSPYTHTYSLIQKSQAFVLQMLAQDQELWLERFGLKSGHDYNKFEGIEVGYTKARLPILPKTCGWAACRITHQQDLGDRILLVADVLEQSVTPNRRPLRRQEGLAALPGEVMQALKQQRLDDIDRDRPLRPELQQGETR